MLFDGTVANIFKIANLFNLIKCCLVKDLDSIVLESAVIFSEKWIKSPKQYVSIILPEYPHSNENEVLKLSDILRRNVKRNAYFLFISDFKEYRNKTKHHQEELLWFPYELGKYELNCQNLGLFSNSILNKKHFFFFSEDTNQAISLMGHCPIQFNHKIVVYYWQNETPPSNIVFEEFYKINPLQITPNRNILSKINKTSQKMESTMLEQFIWKRRRNLQGTTFKAITELWSPFIDTVKESRDFKKTGIVRPEGYFSDIMDHLMANLNFTVTTTLPKQRYSWTYLVDQVGQGLYDISTTGFVFNPSRKLAVDFSHGITPISYSLFYAKHRSDVHLDLFLRPFSSNSWVAVLIYAVSLVIGFIILSVFLRRGHDAAKLSEFLRLWQKGTSFVLRSIVGTKINYEPKWNSTKIAFGTLVLNGFLLITCYRALLVASVTIQIDRPPIKSLSELSNSKYLLALEKGSAPEAVFLTAKSESEEYRLVKNNKTIHFSGDFKDFLDQMIKDQSVASRTILFDIYFAVQFHEGFPCSLLDIKDSHRSGQGSAGMIYRKNWPFKDFLNYHLLLMTERGWMDKLYQPYIKRTKKSCPEKILIQAILNKPSPVTMNATFSLYLIIFIGLSLSSICLIIEVMCGNGTIWNMRI